MTIQSEEHMIGSEVPSRKSPVASNGDVRVVEHERQNTAVSTLDSNATITNLYLTFDLPLPEPSMSYLSDDSLAARPNISLDTNPHNWPKTRKRVMLLLGNLATFATAYTAGVYSPAALIMAAEFGVSRPAVLVGITTYTAGFGIMPMILAPLSETYGRYKVFVASGVVFVVFQAVCGLATNLPGMLMARFLCGCGASVFSSMVGGVIADLWPMNERNTPMCYFSGATLVGTGLGPLFAGIMVQRLGEPHHAVVGIAAPWRWIFWHQVIFDAVIVTAVAVCFHESRSNVLLRRRAEKLNCWYEALERKGVYGVWIPQSSKQEGSGPEREKWEPAYAERAANLDSNSHAGHEMMVERGFQLQRIRWRVRNDDEQKSILRTVSDSFIHPFNLLLTEPVVFFFSAWVSFAWAVLYLTFGSIPLIFSRQYGFNVEQSGLVFTSMAVASVIATVAGIYQESLLKHRMWQPSMNGSADDNAFWSFMRRRFPVHVPEARLYISCITSLLLPLGLYALGFTAIPSIHWVVPSLMLGSATLGIFFVYLATFNYLADTYQSHASSALAAQSFCRNLLGGAFPLVVAPLFNNLKQGPACGLLGAIATALTVVPWVLVFNGEKIRKRSRFAISLL